MNQANDIELIRHGRELAAHCVQRKEDFAIKHDPRMPPKYPETTMVFQRMVTTPLALCLTLRVHSTAAPFPCTPNPRRSSCASLRTVSLDDSEHLPHNQHASVASLRLLFTFERNAVRLPCGIIVHLNRNTHRIRGKISVHNPMQHPGW